MLFRFSSHCSMEYLLCQIQAGDGLNLATEKTFKGMFDKIVIINNEALDISKQNIKAFVTPKMIEIKANGGRTSNSRYDIS